MIAKLSAAALVLALAVPAFAATTATITQTPADPCANTADGSAKATDCPAAKPGKLGTNIIPLASSDQDSEAEEDEGGDED